MGLWFIDKGVLPLSGTVKSHNVTFFMLKKKTGKKHFDLKNAIVHRLPVNGRKYT